MISSNYESSLEATQRRQNGVHYTSEENILKVINPLFLEGLQAEFEQFKGDKRKLIKLQNKISNLKFLDPACGCGNFFIVTYFYLAKLENKIVQELTKLEEEFEFKVNGGQFYGIEIDPEACKLAVEALEDAHKQINNIYKSELNKDVSSMRPFMPPKIVNENALRMDWNEVISKNELNYIMGNPPFIGSSYRTDGQREDMKLVFGKKLQCGNLDYCAAWFAKAAEFMHGTKTETAFVATSSIAQGQQPAILWKPLMEKYNTEINFAYRSFEWK